MGESGKNFFNTVRRQSSTAHQEKREKQFDKADKKSQSVFKACSEFLEQPSNEDELAHQIKQHEQFIDSLQAYTTSAGDPPLILRGPDYEQERQLALYKARQKYEEENHGHEVILPTRKMTRIRSDVNVKLSKKMIEQSSISRSTSMVQKRGLKSLKPFEQEDI